MSSAARLEFLSGRGHFLKGALSMRGFVSFVQARRRRSASTRSGIRARSFRCVHVGVNERLSASESRQVQGRRGNKVDPGRRGARPVHEDPAAAQDRASRGDPLAPADVRSVHVGGVTRAGWLAERVGASSPLHFPRPSPSHVSSTLPAHVQSSSLQTSRSLSHFCPSARSLAAISLRLSLPSRSLTGRRENIADAQYRPVQTLQARGCADATYGRETTRRPLRTMSCVERDGTHSARRRSSSHGRKCRPGRARSRCRRQRD